MSRVNGRVLAVIFSVLSSLTLFAPSSAMAASSVVWQDISWNAVSAELAVNSDGSMSVTATATDFPSAHYNTSGDFRYRGTAVTFGFYDDGAGALPGIYVEDESTPAGAQLTARDGDYRAVSLLYSAPQSTYLGVGQSEGYHSITIGLRPDGTVDYWYDGALYYSVPDYGMQYIGDVYLLGTGGTVTYTYFSQIWSYDVPTHMDQCKNGGWETFAFFGFGNQGQCVSYVQSN